MLRFARTNRISRMDGTVRPASTVRTRGAGRTEGTGRARRVGAALLGAATVLAAGACGLGTDDVESVATMEKLVIGVNDDQPGVALREPDDQPSDAPHVTDDQPGFTPYPVDESYDDFTGFDIRIAKEIARNLGVNAADVKLQKVDSDDREELLASGKIDMIVASYSITPERKVDTTLAGPYYVSHQDVLVREADSGRIRSIHDLVNKRVCRVEGSISFPRIREEQGIRALPVNAGGYGECLDLLIAGKIDAVSTDDLILAGLARQAATTGNYMEIVNAPISDERYGVGLRKGDVDGCEAVNEAITKMYQDDTIPRQLDRWFKPSGLKLTKTVPQFEGCQ